MTIDRITDMNSYWARLASLLGLAPVTDVGQWQSQDTRGTEHERMLELYNVSFIMPYPDRATKLQDLVQPNLPWAEDHFLERVSGEPLNPPPSEAWWPYAQQGNAEHKKPDQKFSHTYPERMWPKMASPETLNQNVLGETIPRQGIRFAYGDLQDVVQMMIDTPMTRQAYLPIWFPEDTGAVHGERVPCTLGYHFMWRTGKLTVTYYIRSCDLVRHFRDDVYMAARLGQYMASRMEVEVSQFELVMHIANLHCFAGDRATLQYEVKQHSKRINTKLLEAL